jgi:hypothetical protein
VNCAYRRVNARLEWDVIERPPCRIKLLPVSKGSTRFYDFDEFERAIQELAGHRDLTTTQRYMHLSPAALDQAIRLLEPSGMLRSFGDILETGSTETAKSFRQNS